MKRTLMLLAAALLFVVPVGQSYAAEVCPPATRANKQKVAPACEEHLKAMTTVGDQLATCFAELQDEYLGHPDAWGNATTAPGKGNNYRAKRLQCIELATFALDDIKKAYKPGGDTSPRKTLMQAVENWTAWAETEEAQ